jgi:hypothetical protein
MRQSGLRKDAGANPPSPDRPNFGMLTERQGELPMYLHDDADMATVVTTIAKALVEGARHVGKVDRSLTDEQIGQLETAMRELQRAIETRKKASRT